MPLPKLPAPFASRRGRTIGAALFMASLVTACSPPVTETSAARPAPSAAPPPVTTEEWPLKTREHVDLWLHGYAMVTTDTSTVPLFRRGYADSVRQRKATLGIVTVLDANAEELNRQLLERPSLEQGQFVPLYFADWDELKRAVDTFMETSGDPRRASSQQLARMVAFLAGIFPTPADRDWLRLFMLGLEGERTSFFDSYWGEQQAARRPALQAVQSEWQGKVRPQLQRFLNNTRQNTGDLMLSLPIGGEGRMVPGGSTENVVAVAYPSTAAQADQAIYVFVHEIVGQMAQQVVDDNTTPAEKRDGVAARLQSMALVRGGELLLRRTVPAMSEGYMRFYLSEAGRPAGSSPQAAFEGAFPLPDALVQALDRQIGVILGGI